MADGGEHPAAAGRAVAPGGGPIDRVVPGPGQESVSRQSPDGTPMTLNPPSTYRTSPVTALERSDAR